MEAWLYSRVSKDISGRSVPEQDDENQATAERHGWPVTRRYSDNDVSASRYARKARPDWQRLIDDLSRSSDVVLVTWEASRSTRDLEVYITLRKVAREAGALWCYNGRVYDLRRSDDSFSTGLDILLAEKEVDQTRERVLRSVRANASRGRPHGKLLYGYRRDYEAESGRLVRQVPDEVTAPIVREIHRRILAGEACYSIGRDLEARGLPSPRGSDRWAGTTVKRIAVNPAYAALRVHQGAVVGPADWPALVDELTHHRLRARLGDPARRNAGPPGVRHLLTGVARCGVGGCGVTVRLIQNRNTPSYSCRTGHHVSRKQTWVDDLVTDVILERLGRPDAADLFVLDDADARAALAEAAALRERLTGFYDTAAAGGLTPAALARVEAGILPKIERAEAAARRARSPLVGSLAVPAPRAVWDALTVPQQRMVVAELVDVLILRTDRRNRTFDPASVKVVWRS